MSKQLTVDDFRQSLNSHVAQKGDEVWARYGPEIGWTALQSILIDRAVVRYPCEIVFDDFALLPGEFAQAMPLGARPEDGYRIFIHPYYSSQPDNIPCLALYHLVVVNYGEFASADDAETFAAHALGLPRDIYYHALCHLADQLKSDSIQDQI